MIQADANKTSMLKCDLLQTFRAWIRLRLPQEVFNNLVNDCPHLLQLVFSELTTDVDENLQEAVNVIIELI